MPSEPPRNPAGLPPEPAHAPTYLVVGSGPFYKAALALFCAGFATFSLLYCVQPLLPLLSAQFGVSPAVSSLSLSFTTACLAISILLVGLCADRFQRKPLMTISLLAAALAGLAASASPSWHALLLLRALEGIALGGVPAVAMAYLAEEVHPEGLGLAMGLYISGTALGGMSGRAITGAVADLLGWRAAMAVIALLGLLALALFFYWLPPSSRFQPKRRSGAAAATAGRSVGMLRQPRLLGLFALAFLLMGSFVTVYNYIGYRLLGAPFNLSQTVVGSIFVVYLVGIAGSTLFGRLADRHGRVKMLTWATALMSVGLLLTLPQALWVIVVGITLFTFGFFAAHAVASGSVGRFAKTGKARAASIYLLAYYLGSSLLGSFGGTFWSRAGWSGVVGFAAVAEAIALGVCVALARSR